MLSAGPVCSCAHFFVHIAHETAGAARTRSSLRPLIPEGRATRHNSGASRRGNALAYPWPRPDTISADNHPELSPVATVSLCGIFRRLPRGRRQARKNLEEETPTENDLTIKGKAYI